LWESKARETREDMVERIHTKSISEGIDGIDMRGNFLHKRRNSHGVKALDLIPLSG